MRGRTAQSSNMPPLHLDGIGTSIFSSKNSPWANVPLPQSAQHQDSVMNSTISPTTLEQSLSDDKSDIIKQPPLRSSSQLLKQIKKKQRDSQPLSQFTYQERAFLSDRNHRMLQRKRAKNEMIKTQQSKALPDNSKVWKQLLGNSGTHMHKRGQSIDRYQAFKRPEDLETSVYQRQNVLFRC